MVRFLHNIWFLIISFHEKTFKIIAGDIKCENVLVTSWNWIYLADFASFKPTYIPHDDPSDFSFFFDTGGRRRCYLAPEVCLLKCCMDGLWLQKDNVNMILALMTLCWEI